MRSFVYTLCFALLINLTSTTKVYGQKWEKQLSKVESYFDIGKYGKSRKTLDKFWSKAQSKLGGNNQYSPDYYIWKARLNVTTGILAGIDEDVRTALITSATAFGETSEQYAKNLLQAADIYLLYGNYVKADEYLENGRIMLDELGALNEDLSSQIAVKKAEILTGRGFYNESIALINTNLDYLQSRAVTRESYVDDSGNLRTRNLDEEEVMDRLGLYGQALTIKANAFRKQGNFLSADSAFTRAKQWITQSYLGDKSLEYAKNQYLYGTMLVENGLREFTRDTKDEDFDKTLNALTKAHEESHYLAFDLYESLLKWHLYQDNKAKYRSTKVQYEKAIERNFKRTSLHRINLETMEFDSKLVRDRINQVAQDANMILGTTKSLPRYHEKTLDLVDILYRLSIQSKNYANAELYMNQILDIKKNLYGEESVEFHLSKVELANFYVDFSDKIKEAGTIYQESYHGIVENQIDDWHKDHVRILNHLAEYYQLTDDYAKASSILEKALRTARAKFDAQDPDYGVELDQIARLQIKIGNYDKADEYIKEAVQVLEGQRRNEKRVVDYVRALETQATLLAINGFFDDAEDVISTSQRLLRRAENLYGYDELASAKELAGLYITLGKYRTTQESLNNVISSYERQYGRDSRKLVEPLVDKSRLLLIDAKYPEAEQMINRANTIASSVYNENSTKLAPVILMQADFYTYIGDFKRAQGFAERAVKIYKQQYGENHVEVGKATSKLGLIMFYEGEDLNEVEDLMVEARDIIFNKLGNRNPAYAELLVDLSKVYIAQQRYDDAFNSLNLAETIWINKVGRKNNIKTAAIYLLEGDIYYLQRKFDEAEDAYKKAESLYEKYFNKNHPEYVKVLSKLSKVYYMEGDSRNSQKLIEEVLANYQTYIKEFFPALSERQKAKFWNTIRPDYEFYNTLAFELRGDDDDMPGKVYNNALLTKAILLSSSIKIRERILNSTDEELKAKYNEWLDKKEQLTNVLSMSIEQVIENQIDPQALQNEVEQLEKEISSRSEAFSQANENISVEWDDIQGVLKSNEVAVEMVRYRYFDHVFTDSVVYAALYIKDKSQQKRPQVTFIKNGRELEGRYFKAYRNSIILKIPDSFSNEMYWQPLKQAVGNYATIYFSADGVYNQINLEAIPTENDRYVIDEANIILVSNTKDIYLRQTRTQTVQQSKVASMFGNPNFYLASAAGEISSLPGTEKEVNALRELLVERGWNIDAYTEIEAKEEQVKKLNNPKVFHIATHGFFTPVDEHKLSEDIVLSDSEASRNPLLRTGLLLSGAGDLLNKTAYNYNMESGILTAYEAMNLNLDQTELVVLSACETGLGELAVGEGVYGLQRAFMVAGAKSLIMSMFKVDDAATQKLMTLFYKKWLESGKKRESFVQAKKELRTEYQDPIYWGAFIMIGMD